MVVVPNIKFFNLLIVEYSFFINSFRELMIKVIFASSVSIVFSFVNGNLVIIKSIPDLTVGISFSSITWHKAFTTTVLILGNSLKITCSFSSSDIFS